MARPRVQTSTQIQAPGFSPAASPVDTYRQTAEGSGLAQLAGALSSIAPELRRFALTHQQVVNEKTARTAEEQARGDIEALQAARKTYSEARREGLIQEHQDPIFRAVHRETLGRHLGELAMGEFAGVLNSDLKDAATLEEFDTAFNSFYQDFVEANLGDDKGDPALATAFRQTVQDRVLSVRREFSAKAGARYSAADDSAFFSLLHQGTANQLKMEGVTAADIAANIEAELQVRLGQGTGTSAEKQSANRLALESALSAAARHSMSGDNPDSALLVLEAIQQVATSPGNTLGSAKWAQEMIGQAEGQIYQNIARAAQMDERRKDAQLETLRGEATAALVENPNADLDGIITAIAATYHPSAPQEIRSLYALREALDDAAGADNPGTLQDLTAQIYSDPTQAATHQAALLGAMKNGEITVGSFQNLWNVVGNFAASDSPEANAIKDEFYLQARSQFLGTFGADILVTGENLLRREQASSLYTRMWVDFATQNPDASFQERQDALMRISTYLKENFPPAFDMQVGIIPQERWFTEQLMDEREYTQLTNWLNTPDPDEMLPVVGTLYRLGFPPEAFLENETFTIPEELAPLMNAQGRFFPPA